MRFLLAWCATALTMCLVTVADSLLPGGPRLPEGVTVVCFFAAIPAFIGMYVVMWSRFGTPRLGSARHRQFLSAWQAAPLAARVVTVAVVVIATVNFALGMPEGQPEVVSGAYVLSSHGVSTPVSAEVYRQALAETQRGIALFLAMFISIPAIVVLGVRALRGQKTQ